jgi:Uma2 family endonuclease
MTTSSMAKTLPGFMGYTTFRTFTLDEYHKMIKTGVLTDGEPYELLEGYLVKKMSRGELHDAAIQALLKRFVRLLPAGWDLRAQCAVTLNAGSEPEPDFAFVRGDETIYRNHHPGPAEIGLLVEVSNTSLTVDREDKGRIYARAGIPIYWVVNLVDKVIEVYSQPSGPCEEPSYATHDGYSTASSAPVVLDGITVGTIGVADVIGE